MASVGSPALVDFGLRSSFPENFSLGPKRQSSNIPLDSVVYDCNLLANRDGKGSVSSAKDLHPERPLTNAHGQQDVCTKQDVIYAVKNCMKIFADNVLYTLDGISDRLSQVEAYCYNLDQSIGDMRSDFINDKHSADSTLRSLERHLQEVHRSVQIIRDKLELAETQKELAELQLAQKKISEGVGMHASVSEKPNESSNVEKQQLAIGAPKQSTIQVAQPTTPQLNHPCKELPVQQSVPFSSDMKEVSCILSKEGTFYLPRNQLLAHPSYPLQCQQNLSCQPMLQAVPQKPQTQVAFDHLVQPRSHVINHSQAPSVPQPQQQPPQQLVQQFPQQVLQPQQGALEAQFSAQMPPAYPSHQSNQPPKVLLDTFASSTPMPVAYLVPQPGGYGVASVVQHPSQLPLNMHQETQLQGSEQQLSKSEYAGMTPYSSQPTMQGYLVYSTDGNRIAQSLPFHSGSFSPANISPVQNQHSSPVSPIHAPHLGKQHMQNYPHGELVEKAASMGYARDMVASAIYRMRENGLPVDFNTLLDILNAQVCGLSPKAWSG